MLCIVLKKKKIKDVKIVVFELKIELLANLIILTVLFYYSVW